MKIRSLIGAMCLGVSLVVASLSSDGRADLLLDDFTVLGDLVDPSNDIPAIRDLTGDVSVSGGTLNLSGVSKAGDVFYSFATLDVSTLNITHFALDLSAYSAGMEVNVTLRLVDSASQIHEAGSFVFPGPGFYATPLGLFDNGAIADINFAQVVINSDPIGTPNIAINSVSFIQAEAAAVPEPATLATALVGLTVFGLYCVRRRRRTGAPE